MLSRLLCLVTVVLLLLSAACTSAAHLGSPPGGLPPQSVPRASARGPHATAPEAMSTSLGLVDALGRVKEATYPGNVVRSGKNYRVVADHLGSVRAVVLAESTQVVVQRMKFDEFGLVTKDTGSGGFDTVPLPFGYAGGYYDRDTKLVRFGARWYDAQTGRWTTKDPIGLGGGLNLYGYVGNDPINETDVLGLAMDSLTAACKNPLNAAVCVSLLSNAADKIITNAGAKAGQIGGYCAAQAGQFANTAIERFQGVAGEMMESGAISPSAFPPISVFERDGLTFTLDNRRLLVFQEAEMAVRTLPATLQEIAAESWKFTTRNGGVSIRIRGGL